MHQAAEGEKVYFIRHEMGNACEKCKAIDGTIALWSNTPLESDRIKDKYARIALWDGKESNVKTNTIGYGTLHPHCRGFWTRWGTDEFDAASAQLNGKEDEWNAAVEQVQKEYADKGEVPEQDSFVYRHRINEVYRSRT